MSEDDSVGNVMAVSKDIVSLIDLARELRIVEEGRGCEETFLPVIELHAGIRSARQVEWGMRKGYRVVTEQQNVFDVLVRPRAVEYSAYDNNQVTVQFSREYSVGVNPAFDAAAPVMRASTLAELVDAVAQPNVASFSFDELLAYLKLVNGFVLEEQRFHQAYLVDLLKHEGEQVKCGVLVEACRTRDGKDAVRVTCEATLAYRQPNQGYAHGWSSQDLIKTNSGRFRYKGELVS